MSDSADLLVHGPASGRLIGKVARSTAEEVRAAIARARAAQADWGARPVADRIEVLRGVRDRLLLRADELAETLSRETGASRAAVMLHDVAAHLELLSWVTEEAPRVLMPAPLPLRILPHRGAYTHPGPVGVVGVVGPAASPVALGFGAVALALVAGNGVVLLPSAATPLHAALVRDLYREGGLPTELLQVVYGGDGPETRGRLDEATEALVEGGVNTLAVAGVPAAVGRVAAACAERGVPCVVEGCRPATALVLGDAPVERTVRALEAAAFEGQAGALRRVIVDDRALEPLLAALVARVQALGAGGPQGGGSEEARAGGVVVASEAALQRTEAWVAEAKALGATVACGGHRLEGEGHRYAPTVLRGAPPTLPIPPDLGPVLVVDTAAGDDGLAAATGRHAPLSVCYVHTADGDRGRRLAERLDASLVVVNEGPVDALTAVHAWGGAEGALRSFTRLRAVNHPTFPWLAPLVAAWLPSPTAARLARRFGRGPWRLLA